MATEFQQVTPSQTSFVVSATSVILTNQAATPVIRTINGSIDLYYEVINGRTVFSHLQIERTSPADFLFIITEMTTGKSLSAQVSGVKDEVGGVSKVAGGQYTGSFLPVEARIAAHQFDNSVLLRASA